MHSSTWIAGVVVLVVGCGGSNSSLDAAATAHKTFTWDVDGTHYDGEPFASASVLQGALEVQGMDSNAHAIHFALMGTTAGTYDLTQFPGTSFTYADHTQTWEISTTGGGSGSVVISSFTATSVTGTFTANPVPSGSATGMPAITNGVFDLVIP